MGVPDVLLSGNHVNIEKWRHEQKIIRTWTKRPDLLNYDTMSQADKEIIERYKSI